MASTTLSSKHHGVDTQSNLGKELSATQAMYVYGYCIELQIDGFKGKLSHCIVLPSGGKPQRDEIGTRRFLRRWIRSMKKEHPGYLWVAVDGGTTHEWPMWQVYIRTNSFKQEPNHSGMPGVDCCV
ncbi:hypothetical protein N7530_000703 [Penicillium desertorum]|uniref:Transposase n=1 Tax=Penicillium desertorum TaxID=1303715 RepID=A0A9X0BVM0_9EURO|nr:hypothetical protein N7530_000703 [Penicillium desertorum]